MEPSVKGSLFVNGVVAVRHHRKSAAISEDQLAARLGPVALELLDRKIDYARWYPARAYCELVDLDWDLAGGREPDYMRGMGKSTAQHFFRARLHQQLDYARRARRPQGRSDLLRQAKLIITVTHSFYNFLSTEVRVEGAFVRIIYDHAAAFSEALRYTTEGFMNEINRRKGASRLWTSERVTPDRVCFHQELPDWILGSE